MITKDEVIPLFLEACPSFAPRWQEHCGEWGEERLLYVDLGQLAHHIVDQLAAGRIEELPALFAVCERLHLDGDPEVQQAATIGLLEGIQNIALNAGIAPDEFRPFLGAESLKWWDGLSAFWQGRSPFVRAEPTGEG